ncbi:hypothetical protein V5799_017146 [Amblyomma americanum]|uniref:Glycosyltransferase 2-like domain-containing protein n=1 Tax=Amblyomma americanum TaxID=6943 RepID=A0AAQ4F301_AMBAM
MRADIFLLAELLNYEVVVLPGGDCGDQWCVSAGTAATARVTRAPPPAAVTSGRCLAAASSRWHTTVNHCEAAPLGSAAVPDASRLGVIHNAEDQRVKVEGYHQHAFNVLISNRLGKVRTLPDTRNPLCRQQAFDERSLPTASVVVCFYNEAWSALVRTVHTVLERTPPALLHELILVDDNSTLPELGLPLVQYVASELPAHVRLIRTPAREGLIRARMHGARNASGQVLVFLDSHCEVNVGWLEPLLARIGANRTTVTCPVIDIINADTFEYSASPIVRGGFNWGLHFKWESPPRLRGPGHAVDPIP